VRTIAEVPAFRPLGGGHRRNPGGGELKRPEKKRLFIWKRGISKETAMINVLINLGVMLFVKAFMEMVK
jgi:hypothetical protein